MFYNMFMYYGHTFLCFSKIIAAYFLKQSDAYFPLLCMLPFIPLVGISGIIKNYYLGKEDVWNLFLAKLSKKFLVLFLLILSFKSCIIFPCLIFSQHCYYCYEYWGNHFYSFFNVTFKKESQLALSSPFLFSKSLSIQRYDEYCFTFNRIRCCMLVTIF